MDYNNSTMAALAVVIIIIVVAYWAYNSCRLNGVLPDCYDKAGCPTVVKYDPFVGGMGKSANMVPCAYPVTSAWNLNRCNWA